MLLVVRSVAAGSYDLLWDFSASVPTTNPDRGLSYSGLVNDAEGVKNGLKGIKLNSSGWCSFTKGPVAGELRLTFGPRNGRNAASLQVYAGESDEADTYHLVDTTCEVDMLQTQTIPLRANQNKIYITRLRNMETVLTRIEFVEGVYAHKEACAPIPSPVRVYSADMRVDTMSVSATFFIRALMDANKTGHKTIYLPNGVYDLGELALTAIEANGIAIIGESMEGTVIVNAPDYRYESIDKSATLRILPGVQGTYLANLTIRNELDYYHDNNGRAVALWDQGTKTVCRNVRLMSHQDTYYADCEGGLKYFEQCEIYGTVDFICGNGNVYFKECLLHCLPRSKDGSGTDALTASGAGKEDKGFVFESCVVRSECPVVSLGRSWKNYPRCVFLNTRLDASKGKYELENRDIRRWTTKGMTTLPERFGEYRTTDTEGNVVSPDEQIVEFTYRNEQKTMNTILTEEEASHYTMEQVLGEWAKEAIQTTPNINKH